MFSMLVYNYLNDWGGTISVPNFKFTKRYRVRLSSDGTEIELLDRPHLAPIPLAVFDKVEECLNRGIHKPGCARNRLGELHLDNQTIMYHVGKDVFGKNDGDSILDNGCYIFAILDCEGCIVRKRGNISLRNSTYEEIVELIEKAIQKDRNILKKFLLDGRVFDFCLCRFGTPDGKHKTLEEVSRELGITCEAAQQMEGRVYRCLSWRLFPEFKSTVLFGEKCVSAIKHWVGRRYPRRILDFPDECINNAEFLLTAIRRNPRVMRFVPEAFRSDYDFVERAVFENGLALRYVSDKFRADYEITMKATEGYPAALFYSLLPSEQIYSDRRLMLAHMQLAHEIEDTRVCGMKKVSPELMSDREFIKEAVWVNWGVLEYVSDGWKADREIVLNAVESNGCALEFVSDELKADREIVLKAVESDGCALEFAADELKADREIVKNAITLNPLQFQYASDAIKSDREFWLYAMQECGVHLSNPIEQYNTLQEIMYESIEQRGVMLKFAPSEVSFNRDVVLKTVKNDGMALEFVVNELKADHEIVLEAVKQDGSALEYASDELKADREIVLEAVKCDGLPLEYAANELKADREIVLEAVKQAGSALEYVSDELKADREIVLEAVKCDGLALEYAANELKVDREIVLEAVKRCGLALKYAADELKADREIVLEAVTHNSYYGIGGSDAALKYAADELKADREIVMEAVKRDYCALRYAVYVDREIVLEAIKRGDEDAFNCIADMKDAERLINDADFEAEVDKILPNRKENLKKLLT